MALRNETSGKIHIAFVLCVFALFVAVSFLLILIGIKQYSHTKDAASASYVKRTVSSYVQEKIRQHDSRGCMDVLSVDGCDALALTTKNGELEYTTLIYCYEGSLRELVITDTSVYSLSSGQKIVNLKEFSPVITEDGMIRITVTETNGNTYELLFSPTTMEGGTLY